MTRVTLGTRGPIRWGTTKILAFFFAIGEPDGTKNSDYELYSAEALPFGEWTYLVATYDLDSTTQTLYINGVQVAQNTNGPSAIPDTPAPFEIGRHWSAREANSMIGSIAGVAVYDYALSAEQVQSHYAAIPEPGSLVLLGAGVAGLLLIRRRLRSA